MIPDDRVDAARTALLVIDVQERLFVAMDEAVRDHHLGRMIALVGGARALQMPILWTEQYPKGLGPTVGALAEALVGSEPMAPMVPMAKTTFSCLGDDTIRSAVAQTGRDQWLVAGMETHICVLQTVRDLLGAGHDVHVVADACLSRSALDYGVGLDRAASLGTHISSTETALFDALGVAGGEAFKTISRLIR